MHRLARTLGCPVVGTTKSLMPAHYGATGFDAAFSHILVATPRLPDPRRRLELKL